MNASPHASQPGSEKGEKGVARPKQNLGNRSPRTAKQLAALAEGAGSSPVAAMARRQRGLSFARRYRAEQPFRALLDSIYGPATCAAEAPYPFREHRTCADWLEAA